jgi:hypothetical protein
MHVCIYDTKYFSVAQFTRSTEEDIYRIQITELVGFDGAVIKFQKKIITYLSNLFLQSNLILLSIPCETD